jgi:hypothetical protein
MKYFRSINLIAIFTLFTATFGYAATPIVQEIPAGAVIPVRMIDPISSNQNELGQVFRGVLAAPVVFNNQVVLPQGTPAEVRLVGLDTAGHLSGRNHMSLQLDRIGNQPVHSQVIGFRGSSQGKKTARSAGIGGAIGAGVGAIFGGGSGAAIGAGLGAGTGVATRAFKEPRPIVIVSQSVLNFRLASPMPLG